MGRIRVANESGAWRSMLEHIGIGRRLQIIYFDIADHTEKFETLLGYFGTSYQRAVIELTTLPYWLLVSATSDGSRLPGADLIPALQKRVSSTDRVSNIRHVGSRRTMGGSVRARYCPKCLIQDYEEVGQPYWHRAHQLANVHFCHKHHCSLRVECQQCGALPGLPIKKVLPMASLVCSCGARLDKVSSSLRASESELRLARISVQALNAGKPTWGMKHVFDYLKLQLNFGTSPMLGQYNRVIEEAFPTKERTTLSEAGINARPDELVLARYLNSGGAPEYYALLAALDIELASAIVGFTSNQNEETILLPLEQARSVSITVAKARIVMLRNIKLFPHKSINQSGRYYWYLRLYDSEWLRELLVRKRFNDVIPSIQADREDLLSILDSPSTGRGTVRLNATLTPAGIRATLRDKKWFSAQKASSTKKSRQERANVRNNLTLGRAHVLEVALRDVLASEDRPTRIFAPMLGKKAGLSPHQATTAIKSLPALREAIIAANDDKTRRQVLWAAKHLHAAGVRLSKKQLGKRAGVPTAHVSDAVMDEIRSIYLPMP